MSFGIYLKLIDGSGVSGCRRLPVTFVDPESSWHGDGSDVKTL